MRNNDPVDGEVDMLTDVWYVVIHLPEVSSSPYYPSGVKVFDSIHMQKPWIRMTVARKIQVYEK